MRLKAAIIVLLVFGIALAANLLLGDRSLSPLQLENVRTACPECHGDVPEYDRVLRVHNRHAAFRCSICHEASGMKTTDKIQKILKRVGAATMLLALLGIVTNLWVIPRRKKGN